MTRRIPCLDCRASVPDTDGPTHRYIGASPGCWALYGEVLTRDPGPEGNPPEHRLIVDAYAAQHPGSESLSAIRSVAGHLIVLHLVIERALPPSRITDTIRRYAERPEYRWLPPPADLGSRTIVDVHAARGRERPAEACTEWAIAVWEAWAEHHETIRTWAAR